MRLRPALIFKREAASGIRRLFAGPLLPSPLVRPELLPVLPLPAGLRVQAVHSDDVGEAYRLAAIDERARGAYNVAADPVLDAGDARPRPRRARRARAAEGVRAAADLTWRARLQPTPPGWLDMGMAVPIMDSGRIRAELGWAAAAHRRRGAAASCSTACATRPARRRRRSTPRPAARCGARVPDGRRRAHA